MQARESSDLPSVFAYKGDKNLVEPSFPSPGNVFPVWNLMCGLRQFVNLNLLLAKCFSLVRGSSEVELPPHDCLRSFELGKNH